MKTLPLALLSIVVWISRSLSAASLMINLRSTSADAAAIQANTGYPNTTPFNTFDEGNNFVSFDLTPAAGEPPFLASAGETRGFLNMVQIASMPEPSVWMSGLAGLVPLFRRR